VWLAVERDLVDASQLGASHRPPPATGAEVENARRSASFQALAEVIVDDDLPPDEIVALLTAWARACLRR
jgi:hypothetical protein